MTSKYIQFILRAVSFLLVIVFMLSYFPVIGTAVEDTADPLVVVSLGDSYSSGEGIAPFYGPEKEILESAENFWNRRFSDNDWLAHRSPQGWPGQLKFTNMSGTLNPHKVPDGETGTGNVQWYFVASSGAVSKEIYEKQQSKKYYRTVHDLSGDRGDKKILRGTKYLPVQLDVFSKIRNSGNDVDYVTLTIGGNDVQFSTIVEQAAHPKYSYSTLEQTIKNLEDNVGTHETNIKKAYTKINDATGGTAQIIVAGYPKLFNKDGKGALISKKEATLINEKVVWFNGLLEKWVDEKRGTGVPIHFVDVMTEFNTHEAYSSDAWINPIYLGAKAEDLDERKFSSYAMHPTARGAQAYAKCVNDKIKALESLGTLSGKICKAYDMVTPIKNAEIVVTGSNACWYDKSDRTGNYSIYLPEDQYQVKVTADGYIEFNAYATIEKNEIYYMETFLMVEGEEGQIGNASGTITNALNGIGIEGVQLDVRKDWNNTSVGEILATATTDASGNYMIELPIGNYTLSASKDGFVSTMINIVVQPNMCTSKDGSMTPNISGDNYRVVLTWGENPSDLDSHVVGNLSNGNSFHVYFGYKSQYDEGVEVCNLDYDDTTSYGPETITLNATTNNPYYYYIYRFAGSGTVASSGAQVNVYQGDNKIATFNVPTNLGSGDYWNVFAIVDGQLVVRNTMTSYAETSYASSNISTFSLRAPRVEEHPVYDDRYPAKEEETVEETEAMETEPTETEPVETEPVETEPVETEPTETEPVETEPVETEPVETEPVETEPTETEPLETEPAETESAEIEPMAADIEPVTRETEYGKAESEDTDVPENADVVS